MHFLSVIIHSIYFFLFLFVLYGISKDDYVLFKKHITTDRIFDMAFLAALVFLFSARLLFVMFHFSSAFFNPLVFFLFPYFPGLFLVGGVVGGVSFIIFYCRSHKLPLDRFIDLFGLSFFGVLPVGIFLRLLIEKKTYLSFLFIGAIFISFLLFYLLFKFLRKEELKEGSIGFLSLISFCIISFVIGFVNKKELVFSFLNVEDFFLIFIFLVSLVLFIRREKVLSKLLNLWSQK